MTRNQSKGLQKCGPRMKLGSHISCSWGCRKTWGNETPHTPKWTLILGVGLPMDFQIFKGGLQGSKFIASKHFLYHWKDLWMHMSKLRSHDPFGYLKHKLWLKERSGVKLPIWLPTTKIQESPWFTFFQVACDIPLEKSWRGLQLCFKPHLNWKSAQAVMGLQSCKIRSPKTKWHLGVRPVAMHR